MPRVGRGHDERAGTEPVRSSSGLLAAAGVIRMLDISESRIDDGLLGLQDEGPVVHYGERGQLGEQRDDGAGLDLKVHLQGGDDVLAVTGRLSE